MKQHIGSQSDIEVAINAARAGAAVLMDMYGRQLSRQQKSATDFATDADLAAEQAILAVISDARPQDAVLGEELGQSGDASSRRTWLPDLACRPAVRDLELRRRDSVVLSQHRTTNR